MLLWCHTFTSLQHLVFKCVFEHQRLNVDCSSLPDPVGTLYGLSFYVGLPNGVDEEHTTCTSNVQSMSCFVNVHKQNSESLGSIERRDIRGLTLLGEFPGINEIADVCEFPSQCYDQRKWKRDQEVAQRYDRPISHLTGADESQKCCNSEEEDDCRSHTSQKFRKKTVAILNVPNKSRH